MKYNSQSLRSVDVTAGLLFSAAWTVFAIGLARYQWGYLLVIAPVSWMVYRYCFGLILDRVD